MPRDKIGIIVSGKSSGTNFQAILDAISRGELDAEVAALISTNGEHGAVLRAEKAGIDSVILDPKKISDRNEWDQKATDALYERGVSIVCLAGYLRRLTQELLDAFPRRILNIHPSLLPSFGGRGMFGMRVHEAVLEHGCKVSGCTVHFVNEHYDTGPIIAQACVPVLDDDTPETLGARIQAQEHRLYPQCIESVLRGKLIIEGRRVKG